MTPYGVDAARNRPHNTTTPHTTHHPTTTTTTHTPTHTTTTPHHHTHTPPTHHHNPHHTHHNNNHPQSTNRAGIPMPPAVGPRGITSPWGVLRDVSGSACATRAGVRHAA